MEVPLRFRQQRGLGRCSGNDLFTPTFGSEWDLRQSEPERGRAVQIVDEGNNESALNG